ncbi:MAG: Gfo/Idh/MocA family oxidoreductase [Clostridia bacterium]
MKTRIGLIGCGGRMNIHINSIGLMDDVEVVAIADPVEKNRIKASTTFPNARVYENHTALYDAESKETLDCVFIAIEPTAHTDTETRAIEMGIPFLVEKPMTLDLDLADEIAAKVKEKNLVTAVGFQDRYLDLIEMIKDELPNHKPGGLVYSAWIGGIPGVWWWQKKSTCGAQLVEQNIHLLDGLRFLYGEAKSIYATYSRGINVVGTDTSAEYDTDDHSTAVICFENGVTATLVSGCFSKNRDACSPSGMVITMSDITFDYRLRNNLITKTAGKITDVKRGVDQNYLLAKDFIKAVKLGDPTIVRSPYEDGLKSLKLAFAANQSMETGEVIYFN